MKTLTIKFTYIDIINVRPDLTNEQAKAVLSVVARINDESEGINTLVMKREADHLFPLTEA